jgi:hypothetical protein
MLVGIVIQACMPLIAYLHRRIRRASPSFAGASRTSPTLLGTFRGLVMASDVMQSSFDIR